MKCNSKIFIQSDEMHIKSMKYKTTTQHCFFILCNALIISNIRLRRFLYATFNGVLVWWGAIPPLLTSKEVFVFAKILTAFNLSKNTSNGTTPKTCARARVRVYIYATEKTPKKMK